jgi:hypothetical protein
MPSGGPRYRDVGITAAPRRSPQQVVFGMASASGDRRQLYGLPTCRVGHHWRRLRGPALGRGPVGRTRPMVRSFSYDPWSSSRSPTSRAHCLACDCARHLYARAGAADAPAAATEPVAAARGRADGRAAPRSRGSVFRAREFFEHEKISDPSCTSHITQTLEMRGEFKNWNRPFVARNRPAAPGDC